MSQMDWQNNRKTVFFLFRKSLIQFVIEKTTSVREIFKFYNKCFVHCIELIHKVVEWWFLSSFNNNRVIFPYHNLLHWFFFFRLSKSASWSHRYSNHINILIRHVNSFKFNNFQLKFVHKSKSFLSFNLLFINFNVSRAICANSTYILLPTSFISIWHINSHLAIHPFSYTHAHTHNCTNKNKQHWNRRSSNTKKVEKREQQNSYPQCKKSKMVFSQSCLAVHSNWRLLHVGREKENQNKERKKKLLVNIIIIVKSNKSVFFSFFLNKNDIIGVGHEVKVKTLSKNILIQTK